MTNIELIALAEAIEALLVGATERTAALDPGPLRTETRRAASEYATISIALRALAARRES